MNPLKNGFLSSHPNISYTTASYCYNNPDNSINIGPRTVMFIGGQSWWFPEPCVTTLDFFEPVVSRPPPSNSTQYPPPNSSTQYPPPSNSTQYPPTFVPQNNSTPYAPTFTPPYSQTLTNLTPTPTVQTKSPASTVNLTLTANPNEGIIDLSNSVSKISFLANNDVEIVSSSRKRKLSTKESKTTTTTKLNKVKENSSKHKSHAKEEKKSKVNPKTETKKKKKYNYHDLDTQDVKAGENCDNSLICVVCMEYERKILFDCKHYCCCAKCCKDLMKKNKGRIICPICREKVKTTLNVIKS
jgi:hypothetical protein